MVADSYFSAEAGTSTRLTYAALAMLFVAYTVASILAPLLAPPCHLPEVKDIHPNPDYTHDPCGRVHYLILLGLSKWEADMNVRVIMSLCCGSLVGLERRRADRPAGIRTMALVALGSCTFTIASMFAFISGPMAWDASRVSAAIPSGVGFLGAASIWKGTREPKGQQQEGSTPPAPEVHGLTTATSVRARTLASTLHPACREPRPDPCPLPLPRRRRCGSPPRSASSRAAGSSRRRSSRRVLRWPTYLTHSLTHSLTHLLFSRRRGAPQVVYLRFAPRMPYYMQQPDGSDGMAEDSGAGVALASLREPLVHQCSFGAGGSGVPKPLSPHRPLSPHGLSRSYSGPRSPARQPSMHV